MPAGLASVEKHLLALDKKTFYRWLRQNKTGSSLLRYVGGYLFWLVYARRPYVGTRVVEIPWAMKRLKEYTKGRERLLVVGDVITRKLADVGYDVDLVDMDAEATSGASLRVQKMDIREAELPAGAFDVTVAISTLEHIGVQGMEFANGDRLAMNIIRRSMKPGGLLLLTVPFGKPYTVKGFTRIYDRKELIKLLQGSFTIEEELYYIWNGFKWKSVPYIKAERAGFLRGNADKYSGQNLGLAMLTAKMK